MYASKLAVHDPGLRIDAVAVPTVTGLRTEVKMKDEAIQSQGLSQWWTARDTQTDGFFGTLQTAPTAVRVASSQTASFVAIYGQDEEVQVETLRMRVSGRIAYFFTLFSPKKLNR